MMVIIFRRNFFLKVCLQEVGNRWVKALRRTIVSVLADNEFYTMLVVSIV
ncbi:MAG: hypothetical protein LBU34_16560 [Planctomycetaceae bacterium]|nr:hypothetical protein [Planctomycetaceae bacterium]